MYVTNIQRFATCFVIAGAFVMGYLAHGFEQLDIDYASAACGAAVVLFMWMVWDLLDQ